MRWDTSERRCRSHTLIPRLSCLRLLINLLMIISMKFNIGHLEQDRLSWADASKPIDFTTSPDNTLTELGKMAAAFQRV